MSFFIVRSIFSHPHPTFIFPLSLRPSPASEEGQCWGQASCIIYLHLVPLTITQEEAFISIMANCIYGSGDDPMAFELFFFFWHHMLWQGCESCEKETSGEVSLDVPDRICNRTDGLIFTSYSCGGGGKCKPWRGSFHLIDKWLNKRCTRFVSPPDALSPLRSSSFLACCIAFLMSPLCHRHCTCL